MTASHHAFFDGIATLFASAPWALPLARGAAVGGAYVVGLLVLWSLWRHPAERRHAVWALVACALATLLSHYLAARIGVPRPFVAGASHAYISHSPTGSLPSSHATVMLLIALIYLRRRVLRGVGIAMVLAVLATGVGRVCVGVHYPLDIVAGFALAALLAAFFWWGEAVVASRHRGAGVRRATTSQVGSASPSVSVSRTG